MSATPTSSTFLILFRRSVAMAFNVHRWHAPLRNYLTSCANAHTHLRPVPLETARLRVRNYRVCSFSELSSSPVTRRRGISYANIVSVRRITSRDRLRKPNRGWRPRARKSRGEVKRSVGCFDVNVSTVDTGRIKLRSSDNNEYTINTRYSPFELLVTRATIGFILRLANSVRRSILDHSRPT